MPNRVLSGLLLGCILLLGARMAEAQEQRPQLAIGDLLALLAAGLPETRIIQMVAETCVVGGADPATQRQLEEAGASTALRRTTEALACPPIITVVTLTVIPSSDSVVVEEVLQLSATPRDAGGNALTDRTVTWTSSDTLLATVNASGLVTGVSTGTVTITATSDGQSGSATVTVRRAPPPAGWVAVATVLVMRSSDWVAVDETLQLTATLRDTGGNALTGRTIMWTSSDPARATVNGSGLVTGESSGTVSITATSEGQSGSATLAVTASPPPDRLPVAGGGPPSLGMLGVGFADDQFSLISAGAFQMGSIDGDPEERPVHAVAITRPFYMQRTEVTQGQWREIMGENPTSFSSCGDTCPVEGVSWTAIQEFLVALNERYPGRNYRLPTEAEWEYAARAGTTGDFGGTGNLDEMGWYFGNSRGQIHPVARKAPNAWGLYDMHGNVWEWVQDWYASDYYRGTSDTDPNGPTSGSHRVLRGGSWYGVAGYARSASRFSLAPSSQTPDLGFRLARTP